LLVTTDGAPELTGAIEQRQGKSLRQRCLAYKVHYALDKVSSATREEVRRRVQNIFYAPSLETAKERAAKVLRECHRVPALPDLQGTENLANRPAWCWIHCNISRSGKGKKVVRN
jgi:transposase-like protein